MRGREYSFTLILIQIITKVLFTSSEFFFFKYIMFSVCNSTIHVLNNQNVMEASGWSINFGSTLFAHNGCTDDGSWSSFSEYQQVGSMSYTFSGEGTFKLQFGILWLCCI